MIVVIEILKIVLNAIVVVVKESILSFVSFLFCNVCILITWYLVNLVVNDLKKKLNLWKISKRWGGENE